MFWCIFIVDLNELIWADSMHMDASQEANTIQDKSTMNREGELS